MTRSIAVTRHVRAPVADVFAAIADSDRLGRLPGVRVEVLKAGLTSRDDVCMQRRVAFPGGVFLVEEVVGLEPPRSFDYRIRSSRPKMRHDEGRIAFEAEGAGTRVTWTSTFGVPAGPLTAPAEAIAALGISGAFDVALRLIDRRLRQGSTAATDS